MGHLLGLSSFLICYCVFISVFAEQCNVTPKCSCQFDQENVPVEEQAGKGEALAGAVGALGSLLVSGGGFGIWYLLKGKKMSSDGLLSRSNSELSETSDFGRGKEGKGPPPSYKDPSLNNVKNAGGQPKPTNIYHSAKDDDLNSW